MILMGLVRALGSGKKGLANFRSKVKLRPLTMELIFMRCQVQRNGVGLEVNPAGSGPNQPSTSPTF